MRKFISIGLFIFSLTFISDFTSAYASTATVSSTYDEIIEFYGGKYKYVRKIKCYDKVGKYAGLAKLYKRISGSNSQYIIDGAPNGYSYELFPTPSSPNNNAFNYSTLFGPYYVKI